MLLAILFLPIFFLGPNEVRSEGLTFISADYPTLTPNGTRIQGNNNNDTDVPIGRTFLFLHLLKEKLKKIHALKQPPSPTMTPRPFLGCICVPFNQCNNGTIISDGMATVDINFRPCTEYEVCCYIRIVVPTLTPPPTTPTTTTTTPSTTTPTTTTTTTTTEAPKFYCYCVPIYQCIVLGGQMYGGSGLSVPYYGGCIGALVCCSNYPGQFSGSLPLPFNYQQPFFLPQPQIAVPALAPSPQFVVPVPSIPVLPPIVYGQSCVCMTLALCGLGFMPATEVANIDPRLVLGRQGQPPGTCSSDKMCCKIRQENATRSIAQQQTSSEKPVELTTLEIKNQGTPNACTCVEVDQCANGQVVTSNGVVDIDPRFGPCMSSRLVCCKLRDREIKDIYLKKPIVLKLGNNSFVTGRVSPRNLAICGYQNTTYAPPIPTTSGSTYLAEFPWMAIILIRQPKTKDVFQCGGSLITSRALLTAAHCVINHDPATLVARLGEWDTRVTTESLPHQDVNVQRIVIHPQYHAVTLYNDVALVILSKSVTYGVNVRPVCLPEARQVFAEGTICYASGWGSDSLDSESEYQDIMRKVDLPIVNNDNCQSSLRQTKLGPSFVLHSSFICAGGKENKDTCYRDGGGPLVCQDLITNRFVQAGIVAWGIGCGETTPGVYASVAQAQQWIIQQLQKYNVDD